MKKKVGHLNVRLDADLAEHVQVIKDRPGGISRFVCDAIRADMTKTKKAAT